MIITTFPIYQLTSLRIPVSSLPRHFRLDSTAGLWGPLRSCSGTCYWKFYGLLWTSWGPSLIHNSKFVNNLWGILKGIQIWVIVAVQWQHAASQQWQVAGNSLYRRLADGNMARFDVIKIGFGKKSSCRFYFVWRRTCCGQVCDFPNAERMCVKMFGVQRQGFNNLL